MNAPDNTIHLYDPDTVLPKQDKGPDEDIIFTPLRFRNLEVKNRVFRSNISGRFDNEDGSLTQTRINWECKFAKGGVGAIISSYVPVTMEGRIIAGYSTIHRDDFIPLWETLGKAVHSFDCKFIMQLSHSGRQMDLPGVANQHRPAPSSTSRPEPLHGFLCRAMGVGEIERLIAAFASAAWRAREAGLDGVELHAANGYLFTQFLSSGINDRTDQYGGPLMNRARFLLEVIPWEGKGNTLENTTQVARWCEAAGADGIHVSTGSLFPHPLNPPGDLSLETLSVTYDAMISSGVHGLRNFMLFRYPLLRPIFRWLWFRMKRGLPVEGVSLDEARAIRQAVSIPVISTGGYQTASFVREALTSGAFDGVSIARSLVANNDLAHQWASGRDSPTRPCTYCNKCLVNAPKNPMGCYEEARFPDRDTMIAEIMSVYRAKPVLRVPDPAEV
jgi:2,4-dienoyl-CoA reductase-like NADH-dependent reductase (Old Yellow Enzyme family)